MNKVNTLKINNSLIKLESENPILKSRSHSFSPLNIAGKIVIKINNNYINNNNNINDRNNPQYENAPNYKRDIRDERELNYDNRQYQNEIPPPEYPKEPLQFYKEK